MAERGKIRNEEFARQLKDFSGLRWGSITPTDIDCFVEFGGRLFIIVEAKHKNAKLSTGQRLGLERLCDAIHDDKQGRQAVLFVVRHETASDEQVNYAETMILEYRFRRKWCTARNITSLKEGIDYFRGRCLKSL